MFLLGIISLALLDFQKCGQVGVVEEIFREQIWALGGKWGRAKPSDWRRCLPPAGYAIGLDRNQILTLKQRNVGARAALKRP